MKNIRGLILSLGLGLLVGISTVGLAQNTKPADQNKKTESCCAMECCKSGSCSMKDHQNKEHAKGQGHEGCCCNGESCNMKMKEKNKEKAG